jgi:two-component system sensor histidine kinase HydH
VGTTFRDKVTAYVGFDERSTAALREARELVAPHFAAIIDDFYATIEAHQDARAAITGGAAQIARLKQSLLRWIDELFTGPHDEAYFQRRLRIGRVHVQINLPQVYMLTAMDRIRVRSIAVLRDAPGLDEPRQRRMLTALHQILDIELAIMLESYREDSLAKNRTAERLATIGQFAAGIGHELRNPLGVVESSAFLVNRRLEQLKIADPGIARHMEKIVTEVQRSGRTINDLLELARNRPLKRRIVDAREFVLQTVPAAHLPAAVQVEVQAPPGVPLDADPDQLARVLTNLLINAGQAMNGAGRIRVGAGREGGATVLRVADEGPGVPSELREQVFQALFTTKAKGSGLGLALCRRIAETHGGTVTLDSSERGAVFRVTIPDGALAGQSEPVTGRP